MQATLDTAEAIARVKSILGDTTLMKMGSQFQYFDKIESLTIKLEGDDYEYLACYWQLLIPLSETDAVWQLTDPIPHFLCTTKFTHLKTLITQRIHLNDDFTQDLNNQFENWIERICC